MDRKEFIQKGWTLMLGKGLELLTENRLVNSLEDLAKEDKPLKQAQRPPGAKEEPSFLKLCLGCDACMIACPENAIMVEDLEKRYPLIYPEEKSCIQCDGYPCIQVCEYGALQIDEALDCRSIP